MDFFIGTAGWSIPKIVRDEFFPEGAVKPDHLKAYAQKFRGVEINSSFYREHEARTYSKWAKTTPDEFRFAIKLAKRFTHEQKLSVDSSDLREVLAGIQNLGEKLGVLLVQIPPKLAFDEAVAEEFFGSLRELYRGPVALEPRHMTWSEREATKLLEEYRVARVVADPDRLGEAPVIRSADVCYYRLHGSPKIYYSDYTEKMLSSWARAFRSDAEGKSEAWCIFDNTAEGHATPNALRFQELLRERPRGRAPRTAQTQMTT